MNYLSDTRTNEAKYWVAFSRIGLIGPIKFKKLINYFRTLESAWKANLVDFINAGFEEAIADKIITERSAINPDTEWEAILQENINISLITDEDYPTPLKNIYDPPAILYYQGSLNIFNRDCLAVVGARKFSPYGKQATERIVAELSQYKIPVVSGLALGIDSIAHQTCLDNDNLTAGILGTGVDFPSIYPSNHINLAQKIIEQGGCIMSEYPIGTPGFRGHFPLRNRIISGLSRGVLVIEAKESSGTLITANYALDQNRDVFAVPGNLFSESSSGTNTLIKKGAKLTTSAKDIIEELNIGEIEKINALAPNIATPEEKIIMDLLSSDPLHVDKIAQLSKLRISALGSLLTMMELKAMIKDMGGKKYVRS